MFGLLAIFAEQQINQQSEISKSLATSGPENPSQVAPRRPPRSTSEGVLDTTSNELHNEGRNDPGYRHADGRPLDAQLNILTPILLPKSIFLALVLLQLPGLLTLTLSCRQLVLRKRSQQFLG